MFSSYETSKCLDKLSVHYKNVCCINGEIYFLSQKNEELLTTTLWGNIYNWKPKIKIFNNEYEIINYTKNFKIINNAMLSTIMWPHNIGHLLWDNFYPSFVALNKFNFINEDFFFLVPSDVNYKEMGINIISVFSENQLLNMNKYNLLIKNLFVGLKGCGNYIVNENCELYGQKEFNSMTLFKNRMLKNFNCESNKQINKKIKGIIINNKRFNSIDFNSINYAIDFFKNSNDLDLKFVNYGDYNNFYEQIDLISDTDLHISGPGTGMLYMPFLKNGAVNINLGQTWYHPSGCKVPSFLEQRICVAADYITTLYYDRYIYENIEKEPLIEIINKAVFILKNKILLNYLNIDALVFKQYCSLNEKHKELCKYLTDTYTTWIEFFINECPELIHNLKNIVDIDLLKNLKNKLKYPNYDINYLKKS